MKNAYWQEMRNEDFIVVDCPMRKVAAYANLDGEVVLAVKDDASCTVALSIEEIDLLVFALLAARNEALPKAVLMASQYEAHLAITKAQGTS